MPINKFNTWFIFDREIDNKINLFRVEALYPNNRFLGNVSFRFCFPEGNTYSDEWERLFPKREREIFLFESKNDVFSIKKLQVKKVENRYNQSTPFFSLKVEYWDKPYLPTVNSNTEDILDELEDQAESISGIEEALNNFSSITDGTMQSLLATNEAQTQALRLLLEQLGTNEAIELANSLLSSGSIWNEFLQ